MTSAIVSATIDADFPVAGQDNDSQGFRDNFSIIKDGLAVASAEVTDLQQNTAKLNEDNDFGGNVIDNAQTNRLYGTVYSTTSTPTTGVSLSNGEYQSIVINGTSHVLQFENWPETDRYAKLRLEIRSSGSAQEVNFTTTAGGTIRKEIGSTTASVSNVSLAPSSVNTEVAYFSYSASESVTGVFNDNDRLFGTGLTGEVTITSISDVTANTVQSISELTTILYSNINPLTGTVSTTTSAASVTDGSKVVLGDVTGLSGISDGTIYYAFGADGTGFKIATSYENAITGAPISGVTGSYTGSATATASLPDLDGSNEVEFSSAGATDNMYIGMPITFTGTSAGGIATSTEYYVVKIIGTTRIQVALSAGGEPVTMSGEASPTLTSGARKVFTTECSSQTIAGAAGLLLTSLGDVFPVPFYSSDDVSKIKIIDVWTADGGANVFMKYVGEFA